MRRTWWCGSFVAESEHVGRAIVPGLTSPIGAWTGPILQGMRTSAELGGYSAGSGF